MLEETLYIQNISMDKKYKACPYNEWVDVKIEGISLEKERVYFSFKNKPKNGGGTVEMAFNQIECNRYMKEIKP